MILSALLLFTLAWAKLPSSVYVPAGSFKPAFRDLGEDSVKIQSMWVDTAPVTNRQYAIFLTQQPQWKAANVAKLYADPRYLIHWDNNHSYKEEEAQHPVVNISWFSARAYCASLNQRLPSLTEWEYFSDASKPEYEKNALLWYSKAQESLTPIMQGKPNRFGLHDTHSLIWEWVEDYSSVFMMADSRQSFTKDMFCAGASIGTKDPSKYATFVRYAMRASLKGNSTGARLGFRCVKSEEKQ